MKFGKIAIAICLTVLAPFTFAGKVAVLDINMAMNESNHAKSRFEALQTNPDFAKVAAQFEALQADLVALQKEAQTKGMTWSNEQVAAHRKKEEYIKADLQLAYQKIQAEQKVASEAVTRELEPMLDAAIKQVMAAEGVDIVLNKQATIISVPAVNITAKVIEALNKAK